MLSVDYTNTSAVLLYKQTELKHFIKQTILILIIKNVEPKYKYI